MSQPIVIKYGGSLLEEPTHRTAFLKQIVQVYKKEKVILVHGGGKEINRAVEAAGLQPVFVNGRRFTDDATLKIVKKTLFKVNCDIVNALYLDDVPAKGYSGENQLVVGSMLEELGRVGIPIKADGARVEKILTEHLPVFYSVISGEKGGLLNANADDVALIMATTLKAKRLVFLTDTGAVLDKNKKPIERVTHQSVEALIQDGTISGGMMVKAKACLQAIDQGVGQVDITKGIEYLFNDKALFEGTSFLS